MSETFEIGVTPDCVYALGVRKTPHFWGGLEGKTLEIHEYDRAEGYKTNARLAEIVYGHHGVRVSLILHWNTEWKAAVGARAPLHLDEIGHIDQTFPDWDAAANYINRMMDGNFTGKQLALTWELAPPVPEELKGEYQWNR